MRLYELLNNNNLDYDYGTNIFATETLLSDGTEYQFTATKSYDVWVIQFLVDFSPEATGGGIPFEVMGATMTSMKAFGEKYKPHYIAFSSDGASRTSLYKALVKRVGAGYTMCQYRQGRSDQFFFYNKIEKAEKMVFETATRYSAVFDNPSLTLTVYAAGFAFSHIPDKLDAAGYDYLRKCFEGIDLTGKDAASKGDIAFATKLGLL